MQWFSRLVHTSSFSRMFKFVLLSFSTMPFKCITSRSYHITKLIHPFLCYVLVNQMINPFICYVLVNQMWQRHVILIFSNMKTGYVYDHLPVKHWDHEFESHTVHVCIFVFFLCVLSCVTWGLAICYTAMQGTGSHYSVMIYKKEKRKNMKITLIWDVRAHRSLKVFQRNLMLSSFALKLEASYSVNFCQTKRHHIPWGSNLHSYTVRFKILHILQYLI
jgi:hypothetical protein